MANNCLFSNAGRSAAQDAALALLNAGGAGTIEIYDGSQPAGPGTAISSQNKLATLTLSATAFAASVNGVAAANAITNGTAIATGTAAWARVKSGAGTAVFDCTVGSSGTDIVLATAVINSGDAVGVTSWSMTHPA